jgi:hypothetical protein
MTAAINPIATEIHDYREVQNGSADSGVQARPWLA